MIVTGKPERHYDYGQPVVLDGYITFISGAITVGRDAQGARVHARVTYVAGGRLPVLDEDSCYLEPLDRLSAAVTLREHREDGAGELFQLRVVGPAREHHESYSYPPIGRPPA